MVPTEIKFVADAMLGSLARKLRIFGFDTLYFRDGPDSELLRIAAAENRVILTGDRAVIERSDRQHLSALRVSGRSERQRLESLVVQARARSMSLVPGEPRCALCNGVLERLAKSEVSDGVPDSVTRRHRLYFRCVVCGKSYWRGGHWRRLRRLASIVRQR